jgi:uncharacterized protein YggE
MPKRLGVVRFAVSVCILALILSPVARAQDNSGITVAGTGKASGKPNIIEIACLVSGDAELTADAIVKYRDARKRAVDAIEALKIPGLTVDSKGYSVKDYVDMNAQQQAMMRGQAVVNSKQKVSVVEQLVIIIKDADKMESAAMMDTMLKVLDTARDAGLTIGDGSPRNVNYYPPPPPPALIKFKIADISALREQAYKQAVEDAKTKAQKLADMAGVKIGKVLAVRDSNVRVPGQPGGENNPYGTPAPVLDQNELRSKVFDEIPLNVSLTVQFEIAK